MVTEEERRDLEAIRADLEAEEREQIAERGFASTDLMRAVARLDQLLADDRGVGVEVA